MKNTLQSNRRIKKKDDITKILRIGKKEKVPQFSIIYTKNGRNRDRFAILVSKRLGSAVKRNNLKRIFREIIRCKVAINPPFYDILISPQIYGETHKNQYLKIRETYTTWRMLVKE